MIYVMSDIHGYYSKFKTMLKKIKFTDNDYLYILGDVIDRGPQPIPLLIDIMSRENITLLMGNHELMFYEAYNYPNSKNTATWLRNGGEITAYQFEQLSGNDKTDILKYIYSLPVVLTNVQVNDKYYYFAHAGLINHKNIRKKENLASLNRKDLINSVWDRSYPYLNINKHPAYEELKNHIFICGHTPTFFLYIKENPAITPGHIFYCNKRHYINVDCGCAFIKSERNGRLGCLCLDTGEEYYA